MTPAPTAKNHHRLGWSEFVDKIFWGASVGIALWIKSEVKTLSDGIASLNVNMATMVERSTNQQSSIVDLQKRMNDIEAYRAFRERSSRR